MNSINNEIYKNIENNIPIDLTRLPQWVTWSGTSGANGKLGKIPIDPKSGRHAKSNDPTTWASFGEALSFCRKRGLPGVGLMLTENDEIVGIDLDHCIDPDTGVIDDKAKKVLDRLNSYSEISPSGQGLHIFVKGRLPEGSRRNGKVEMYDSKRFFTVTGDILDSAPCSVMERQPELLELYQELLASPTASAKHSHLPAENGALSIREAKIHGNGDRFERLWAGDFHDYPSQSEADLALCRLLAFNTNGDIGQIDRLFRQSGLYRKKWDEPHFAGGKTYGRATIEKALSNTDERHAKPGQSSHLAAGQRHRPAQRQLLRSDREGKYGCYNEQSITVATWQ